MKKLREFFKSKRVKRLEAENLKLRFDKAKMQEDIYHLVNETPDAAIIRMTWTVLWQAENTLWVGEDHPASGDITGLVSFKNTVDEA